MQNTDKTPSTKDWSNNPLRARLDAGEYVVGLTITSSNLETAALGAKLGFHFLWVEMEHAPLSLEALRSVVRQRGASMQPYSPVSRWQRCGPRNAYSIKGLAESFFLSFPIRK